MAILMGCACILLCNFSSAVPPHSVHLIGAPWNDGESTEMSMHEIMRDVIPTSIACA